MILVLGYGRFSSKKWGRRESSETTHDEAQPQKEQLMMRHSPKINFFDLLYFAFFSSKSCTFLGLIRTLAVRTIACAYFVINL